MRTRTLAERMTMLRMGRMLLFSLIAGLLLTLALAAVPYSLNSPDDCSGDCLCEHGPLPSAHGWPFPVVVLAPSHTSSGSNSGRTWSLSSLAGDWCILTIPFVGLFAAVMMRRGAAGNGPPRGHVRL